MKVTNWGCWLLVIGTMGCGSRNSDATLTALRKSATLAYWHSFQTIGNDAVVKLKDKPKGSKVAATYREAADRIDRLPLLDVDPELSSCLTAFSRDFRELADVYGRISTRREDIAYGLNKIGESFLRGLALDPFGTFREETTADRTDQIELLRIKKQLRANMAQLSLVRANLTTKYHVEFPQLE